MERLTLRNALAWHWPEFLIEGWALGMFMVSAGLVTVLLESAASPVHALVADGDLRRVLIGISMGLTAVALIYSPWGQRSGAHMNPAVTLTFLILGKIHAWDAVFYCISQFVGGLAGVYVVWAFAGSAFSAPDVNFIATQPGTAGEGVAFAAETGISAVLMLTVLEVSSRPSLARYTGLIAGFLVASFITFEAPLSGMSMNPARSFASAVPDGEWQHFWIYVSGPLLGMVGIALARRALSAPAGCAKLAHLAGVRCIHCGYEPGSARPPIRRPERRPGVSA